VDATQPVSNEPPEDIAQLTVQERAAHVTATSKIRAESLMDYHERTTWKQNGMKL